MLAIGVLSIAAVAAREVRAIQIVLDYALDERNENWFNPLDSAGLARRAAVDSAAAFLSSIITNDDWQPLATLNESITFTDIAASQIFDLDGNPLAGTAESDGQGYSYTASGNDVHTTNRSSVGANEYIVYVGAFAFDAGSSSTNAKGSWDSNDRRNTAGFAGNEFNTWGGDLYFNTTKTWYVGQNPGIDPTDDYGVQDPNKTPATDISTDNWDWNTSSDTWKGFELRSVDSESNGFDLYATAVHELMHVLGSTTEIIQGYVGVNSSGEFIGEHLLAEYGGPVPGDGGHFAENVQSQVWDSDNIISEAVLDPNSLNRVRKYFTNIDAALLRDLGYQVLAEFADETQAGDYNGDGVVDAADYTVWRDLSNSVGNDLAADGSGPGGVPDGAVDLWDYQLWKDNFGNMSGSGSSHFAHPTVPEPTIGLLVATLVGWALVSARSSR